MATTSRMLHLKYLRFRSGRIKNFQVPALETLLLKLKSAAPNFVQRHYPATSGMPAGTLCAFVDGIRPRNHGDGVHFTVSVYTYGQAVEQIYPDFTKPQPDIQSARIIDKQGHPRDIVHTYRCLALGQALLVEYDRNAGGMDLLSQLLAHVFHNHCDKTLPGIELLDVATSKLDEAIKAGGGVDWVSLRLIGGSKPPQTAALSQRLSELGNQIRGTKRVQVLWEAEDNTLDAKAVIKLAAEYADTDSPLDKMSIKLKNGGSIPSLGTYRERRRLADVGLTPDGAIIVSDVETGLCHYLDDLRTVHDGWRVIDDQGRFVAPTVVSVKR